MAGAACKIIINNSVQGAMAALEKVLTSPLVRDKMLSGESCDDLIQALADIDLRTYQGTEIPSHRPQSLVEVIQTLEREGVFTDEVWNFFARKF